MIWVIKGLLVAEWFAIVIVLVLSKYYKSVKVLCSFEQAMEDFNTLTPYICDKWAKTLETPFVAFGESYGANSARWL